MNTILAQIGFPFDKTIASWGKVGQNITAMGRDGEKSLTHRRILLRLPRCYRMWPGEPDNTVGRRASNCRTSTSVWIRRVLDWLLMVFTGRYDHVLDEKGRLAIPASLRNQMNPETDGSGFYLVQESRYLQLVPAQAFETLAGNIRTGLLPRAEVAKARRFLFANSYKLEPDKQGRVMIPDGFMRDSKTPDPLAQTTLNREVTLVGNGDRIEIWNREEFLAHMREAKADLPSFLDTLHGMFADAPTPAAVTGVQVPV
jgi:MraZ protein